MSIAPYEQNGASVARYQGAELAVSDMSRTVTELQQWAQGAAAAHQVAESLVKTSFVPDAFRGKPYEATAAILAGSEVGLSPMSSLRSFDIIQGTAAPKALTLRAIVQSRGHEVWVVESTETRAIVEGRRAGSDIVQRSEWTIARARGLGYLGKKNWKEQPGAMLVARATSECCRLIASDAILGMPYSVEEIADEGAEQAPAVESSKRAVRRRAPQAAPVEQIRSESVPGPVPSGPPLPGEDEEPPVAEQGSAESVTTAQLNKLHASLNEFDVKSREDKLEMVGLLARRQLSSSKELTKDEAHRVIDTLDRLAANEDKASALDAYIAELVEQDGAR